MGWYDTLLFEHNWIVKNRQLYSMDNNKHGLDTARSSLRNFIRWLGFYFTVVESERPKKLNLRNTERQTARCYLIV